MLAEMFSPLEEVLGTKVTAVGSDGHVSTGAVLFASGFDVEIGTDKPALPAPKSGFADLLATARPAPRFS